MRDYITVFNVYIFSYYYLTKLWTRKNVLVINSLKIFLYLMLADLGPPILKKDPISKQISNTDSTGSYCVFLYLDDGSQVIEPRPKVQTYHS